MAADSSASLAEFLAELDGWELVDAGHLPDANQAHPGNDADGGTSQNDTQQHSTSVAHVQSQTCTPPIIEDQEALWDQVIGAPSSTGIPKLAERERGYAVFNNVRPAFQSAFVRSMSDVPRRRFLRNVKLLEHMTRSSSFSGSEGYDLVHKDFCLFHGMLQCAFTNIVAGSVFSCAPGPGNTLCWGRDTATAWLGGGDRLEEQVRVCSEQSSGLSAAV